ncbi:transposase [Streptomyces lonegramiae]|uniref:transposase n=1 Tax=Streptomyces lonegramiae TaxID=3075524 RepID=UPI00374E07EC
MQFAERLTDRQAADAVRSRIDWKYLLGLELEDEGMLPGCTEDLPSAPFEQGVVHRDQERCIVRHDALDDPSGQGQADLIG